ncbi:putative mitochondrial carrierc [Vanrija pseudolonga]|uniref:Purtative mitochondrial carrierc n=1 Tax=Vanrija pseudolonga TaxID=143232 RepID=A0AAF0YAC9_9TREE|nr:purtative mitochondrial carrierc [Vanrija pseudolonga]
MSPPGDFKRESGTARILGSGTSGIAELLVFHPVDTIAKRLMSNRSHASLGNLNQIIFKNAANAPVLTKFMSLFPGLGYAAGYKVAQRVYKFGGQPYFRDLIDKSSGTWFRETFGKKNGQLLMQASAGSLTGIGEVVLLPLDVLKIKMQTNPDALKGRGLFKLITEEGISSLYRGWGWTMARNAPGSFALFGGSAATKQYLFHIDDSSKSTWAQNFVASIGGAVASITVAAPLDVVKTRIQNANFNANLSGVTIIRDMVRTEGVGSFFKGLTPKILVVGPKLVFSYTLAQSLIPFFGKYV